jgi:hypothetical protein
LVRVHQHATLTGLQPQTMLLADRAYDADWIRVLVNAQGVWANIPPKQNRNDPICFSPTFIGPAIWSSGSSTRSSIAAGSPLAMTSSRPTTLHSWSWPRSAYGCAFMSSRP